MTLEKIELIDLSKEEVDILRYLFCNHASEGRSAGLNGISKGANIEKITLARKLKILRTYDLIQFANTIPPASYELTDYGMKIARLIHFIGSKWYKKIKEDYIFVQW